MGDRIISRQVKRLGKLDLILLFLRRRYIRNGNLSVKSVHLKYAH